MGGHGVRGMNQPLQHPGLGLHSGRAHSKPPRASLVDLHPQALRCNLELVELA